MSSLLRRLTWWLRGTRKEAELREELEFHLAQEAEERRQRGTRDDEASFAAQRDLGNEARVREEVRAIWTWRPLDELSQDLKFALRTMLTHRAVTIFAVTSLALGIGANTAIYSFMDAVLLRTLPVPDPDSLVVMTWQSKPVSRNDDFVLHSISGNTYRASNGGMEARIFPYPGYERLRDASTPYLSSIFAVFRGGKLNVLADGQAELTDAQYVSGDFFRGIGVVPAAGRLLTEEDDRTAAPVAVVNAGYAERRFGAAANAVGRDVRINGKPYTIVGVTPSGFDGVEPGAAMQLYLPFSTNAIFEPDDPNDTPRMRDPNYYWVEIMGRLRPGVTLAQANGALSGAFAQWVAATAKNDAERANLPVLTVADGGGGLDTLKRRYQKPLLLLQAIVGLILAIACANTANLLLARAAARQREIAVRLSIGAGRLRLIRQLLTESVVLALVSGVLGIAIAVLGTRLLSALLANGDEGLVLQADVNWNVLLVTIALSVACGLLFGLAPAIQATRPELIPALKDASAGTGRFVRHRLPRLKLQQGLVVAQITLLMLLLVGAGLFARTLANLQSVPLGFNPDSVLLFNIDAPQAGFPSSSAAAYYSQLLDRFGEIPGVRAATVAHSSLPKAGRGHPILLNGVRLEGTYRIMQTGPRFFSTMQIPMLAGREIEDRDRRAPVAPGVISESFARTYFPDVDPIGRHLQITGGLPMEVEIIGVSSAAHYGPVKRESPPVLYVSYFQIPETALGRMTYALRTDRDPMNYVATIRQIVHDADARIPVTNFTTQTAEVAAQINQEILLARICGSFAFVALIIACAGLYGTLAYAVARRTRDIGIRIAIGAGQRRVIWMVVREMCVLAALGLLISVPIARALSTFVQSFLFEMQPNDPVALAFALVMLVAATVAASYGPARRASRIDPTVALRYE